jgi:hypothetical protein
VAATWEYCNTFGGGRTADTVASIATWLNGVNAVYEREFPRSGCVWSTPQPSSFRRNVALLQLPIPSQTAAMGPFSDKSARSSQLLALQISMSGMFSPLEGVG